MPVRRVQNPHDVPYGLMVKRSGVLLATTLDRGPTQPVNDAPTPPPIALRSGTVPISGGLRPQGIHRCGSRISLPDPCATLGSNLRRGCAEVPGRGDADDIEQHTADSDGRPGNGPRRGGRRQPERLQQRRPCRPERSQFLPHPPRPSPRSRGDHLARRNRCRLLRRRERHRAVPTPTTATSAAAETAGATATTPPTPAATAAAPQADQTGVGTSLIALDFRTPQALLTARTANPDGTVSVTWVRTEEQARQTCQIQDRPCSDDTYQQYWAKYANETGSATADCQGMTLVTANLDRDGQTHTL